MAFRDDILRGVRLFAIVFAAILISVWAYRMLRPPADLPSDAQVAPPADSPAPEVAATAPQPPPDAAPATQVTSETHGLAVPPPPPMPGAAEKLAPEKRVPEKQATHWKYSVPPPPPPSSGAEKVARASRAPAPSGREFEAAGPRPLPAAPSEEPSETGPAPSKKAVGYKSLIEANPNRPVVELAQQTTPADAESDKSAKGNRFFRAVGKIFHPAPKPAPALLQPKQQ